jgi:iron complex transport system ATP-binding protein
MAFLDIREVEAGYGAKAVLNGVTLPDIAAGEMVALVGPNAAGKSTLLRVLAGLVPAKGEIRLAGADLLAMSARARAAAIGFMPQSLSLGTELSVIEGVMSALKARGGFWIDGEELHARAAAVLDQLRIAGLGLRPLAKLSGGQRQLASLAQAIAHRPMLLLLDEPTSALDLEHQVTVMEMLRDLANQGCAVILVLHDLALAARWADRIAVLADGRTYAAGAAEVAITPQMLADVYGVAGRVERCSQGRLQVIVDGHAPSR